MAQNKSAPERRTINSEFLGLEDLSTVSQKFAALLLGVSTFTSVELLSTSFLWVKLLLTSSYLFTGISFIKAYYIITRAIDLKFQNPGDLVAIRVQVIKVVKSQLFWTSVALLSILLACLVHLFQNDITLMLH